MTPIACEINVTPSHYIESRVLNSIKNSPPIRYEAKRRGPLEFVKPDPKTAVIEFVGAYPRPVIKSKFANDAFSVTVHPTAEPLTVNHQDILIPFLTILGDHVSSAHITGSRVELRGIFDPEDDSTQLFVRLWVTKLSNDAVQRFHKTFGHIIDRWTGSLASPQRDEFLSKITFQVRSNRNA